MAMATMTETTRAAVPAAISAHDSLPRTRWSQPRSSVIGSPSRYDSDDNQPGVHLTQGERGHLDSRRGARRNSVIRDGAAASGAVRSVVALGSEALAHAP